MSYEKVSKNDYVYTSSGERCEGTFGTYDEAKDNLVKSGAWGLVLKHLPYDFDGDLEEEIVMYEHLPEERGK